MPFTLARLEFTNARAFWREHFAIGIGLAISAMVLTGGLLVGDSVSASLERIASLRLGRVTHVLEGGDRHFREELATSWCDKEGHGAPVLHSTGRVSLPGGRHINGVHVLGVDERFWALSPDGKTPDGWTHEGPSFINRHLADRLEVSTGDTIIARVSTPPTLSADAPLSKDRDQTGSLRLHIGGQVCDEAFGRFNLRADQATPMILFIPLPILQQVIERPREANLLLLATDKTGEEIQTRIREQWTAEDSEIDIFWREDSQHFSLHSRRVFLDEPVETASLALAHAQPILTYFANTLEANTNDTPYSMVTAIPDTWWPGTDPPKGNALLAHPWLAEDLQLAVGDDVTIRYYVIAPMRALVETQAVFQVASILPLGHPLLDPSLMPDFPGLADSENCRDWDPGFPLDLDRIREKDETYWDNYGGTPKAFIPLSRGQALWGNRFGRVTDIRVPAMPGGEQALRTHLRNSLDPFALGFELQPVGKFAAQATEEAMDFSALFLSFSFFLIAAGILLSGLLLVFLVEQRSTEIGTYLAMGFSPREVHRLLLRETGWVVVAASLAGVLLGSLYTRLLLHGLSTVWRDAIGGSSIVLATRWESLAAGWVASVAVAWLVFLFMLRKTARRPIGDLMRGQARGLSPVSALHLKAALVIVVATVGAASGIAYRSAQGGPGSAPGFFQAGSLILIAGLAAAYAVIGWMALRIGRRIPSRRWLSVGNLARRRGRSLTALGLLASGCFLMVSVSSFHQDPNRDLSTLAGGTGGFAWWARLAQPFARDLNDPAAQESFGMNPPVLAETHFLPLRVHEGDEASCLNLNRAQQPRLLGVDPIRLRGRFTFADLVDTSETGSFREFPAPGKGEEDEPHDNWSILHPVGGEDPIPAVADLNSIHWALGKSLGGTLTYRDERGRNFTVKLVGGLANSILQGSVLIDEQTFIERFPSAGGYAWFLVDTPPDRIKAIADELEFGLANNGIELTRTADRMAALDAVQNTYLAIFQSLGAFAILLGSAGLGIVVLRNILERRGELGVLRALGFSRGRLYAMVLEEHGWILAGGLCIGISAAALAVAPQWGATRDGSSLATVILWLVAITVHGLLWVAIATAIALRGNLLVSLRKE